MQHEPCATSRVAWGMIFVCFGISLYYNVIIAYILNYIYFSIFTVLPWSYCDPEWANNNCYIRKEGVVVLFTSFIPFFTLGALLVRGVTLEGAITGLYYYLVPEWKMILDPKVWQKAAEQVFFSLSVAQGMIYSLGSYNDFRNSLVRDVYIIAFADLFVSFVAGMVVFSVLGHMAHNLNVAVAEVVDAGFGLAFVVYPESVTLLGWPNFWSLAFFVMLFFLALASEVSLVEGVLTPIKDEFPACQRHPTRLAFTFCAAYFFLCLPMATKGGIYVLNFLDTYIGGVLLFLLALCEAVSLSLVYGVNRFALDCEFMMESPPGNLIKLCWKFLCPIALINCRQALKPLNTWGPKDPEIRLKYDAFMAERGYGPQSREEEPGVGSAEKPSPGLSETPESPVQNVGEVQPRIEPKASETGI
ncbi:hypothetical protein HPB47_027255 [Ixodes persulcatus]|uniref:Uncharacterized protein n=1 Tax=Ixodes persulcatus TaxID=34615 RepID=A0AC60PXS6_IXOPE|nr:hypothetical protein HPB47_027255 [Ixodes persulcatus]